MEIGRWWLDVKVTLIFQNHLPKKVQPQHGPSKQSLIWKEFEQVEEGSKPLKERRVYKAKMIALDAQLKDSLLTPIPTNVTQQEPKNDFLNELVAERKDPDLFRGLGIFLHKKI